MSFFQISLKHRSVSIHIPFKFPSNSLQNDFKVPSHSFRIPLDFRSGELMVNFQMETQCNGLESSWSHHLWNASWTPFKIYGNFRLDSSWSISRKYAWRVTSFQVTFKLTSNSFMVPFNFLSNSFKWPFKCSLKFF